MAFIPDEAILASAKLTPAAFRLYALYCMRRNKAARCYTFKRKDYYEEIGLSRSRFVEARTELLNEGWIAVDGLTITPLLGFQAVEKSTVLVENPTTFVEIPTESVEKSTKSVEISTTPKNPYKDNQPITSQLPITVAIAPTKAALPGMTEESPDEVLPAQPKTEPRVKPGKQKRGTVAPHPLPEDFKLTNERGLMAEEVLAKRGVTAERVFVAQYVKNRFESFRDYYTDKQTCWCDWEKVWRNWIRNDDDPWTKIRKIAEGQVSQNGTTQRTSRNVVL